MQNINQTAFISWVARDKYVYTSPARESLERTKHHVHDQLRMHWLHGKMAHRIFVDIPSTRLRIQWSITCNSIAMENHYWNRVPPCKIHPGTYITIPLKRHTSHKIRVSASKPR